MSDIGRSEVPQDGKLPADEGLPYPHPLPHEKEMPSLCGKITEGECSMKKIDTKTMNVLGVLIAIQIVLSRFLSISAWNVKIGFGFIPIVVAAILYGPFPAGIAYALSDMIGAILFPVGPYFPGFTLTAFLTGVTYGLFLHKKQSVPCIAGAVAVSQLVLSLLVNSLWISILYSTPYTALLATRMIQCAVLIPTEFIVIGMITKSIGLVGRGRNYLIG